MHGIFRLMMAVFGAIAFFEAYSVLSLYRNRAGASSAFKGDPAATATDFRIMLVAAIMLVLVSGGCVIGGYYELHLWIDVCEGGFAVLTVFPIILLYRWRRRLL